MIGAALFCGDGIITSAISVRGDQERALAGIDRKIASTLKTEAPELPWNFRPNDPDLIPPAAGEGRFETAKSP